MKKLTLLLFILLTLTLTGCTKEPVVEELDCELYPTHLDCLVPEPVVDPVDCTVTPDDPECEEPVNTKINFIDIFYMNDFHGAILENGDDIGMSGIGSYINYYDSLNPDNTIILAGGDMLQGSALSNYYDGLSTINIMNAIGFDAFTLGNHEFDWGLETVTNYFDGDEENGEADFPLLGANVFFEGTTTMPDHIDPYTIITKGDVHIGIIGTMGYGLEYSIATSRIAGYEFANPVPIIEQYAIELREVHDVDIVIWMGHDTGDINDDVAALTGSAKIDAIFNGHSHQEYANLFLGVPVVQTSGTGENVGYVRINLYENNITSYTVDTVSMYESAYFSTQFTPVQVIIDAILLETDPIFNTPILDSAASFNQTDLSKWLAELMVKATGSDVAFQNYGGTRSDITINETITLGVLYGIWPFDNVVKTVYLDGEIINNLINYGGDAYYTTGITFETGTLYKVATNDYVFDKPTEPFIGGVDPTNTGIVLRDLAEDEMILQSLIYAKFDTTNEIQSEDLTN